MYCTISTVAVAFEINYLSLSYRQWSCLSQPAWTTTTKRREENRCELYEAVNVKQNLRSMCCTIEATDRHEVSATTGLLVQYWHSFCFTCCM